MNDEGPLAQDAPPPSDEWRTWRFSGIYGIRHRASGKIYVGQSKNMARRFCDHKRAQSSPHLRHAIKLYGWDAFEKVILETVADMSLLNAREQYWIDFYDATNPEKGYNARPKAESNRGWHPSDEALANMSAASKASHARLDVKAKHSAAMKAVNARPGMKEKRIAALKATNDLPGVKAQRSASQKVAQNRPDVRERFRLTNSLPEVAERRRAAQRDANSRPEVIARKSASASAACARPGRKEQMSAVSKIALSRPDVKNKMRTAHLGVSLSSAHRAAISTSARLRVALSRAVDHVAAEAAGQMTLFEVE